VGSEWKRSRTGRCHARPVGAEAERETIGIIGESLYATCRQPHLPGVERAGDYRPVKPVLAEIQRDFGEEEISGG
jgi:hypothetical protein